MEPPTETPDLAAPVAPSGRRQHPLMRSKVGVVGMVFLAGMILLCVGSLPWTMGLAGGGAGKFASSEPRYSAGRPDEGRLPPSWWPVRNPDDIARFNAMVDGEVAGKVAAAAGMTADEAVATVSGPVAGELRGYWPQKQRPVLYLLGSDQLGRSLLVRCLAGGGISLGIGMAAAFLSVLIGTLYGAVSAYAGGAVDAVMMRIVDILYGLPYILLVVLLKVAVDASVENQVARAVERAVEQRQEYVQREWAGAGERERSPEYREELELAAQKRFGTGELSARQRNLIDVVVLLVAIGGVSWLTMARVIRGQVLSLKAQPFMEAARAMGVGWFGQFRRHLLPNLVGPIVVYATLTVPQAILQESFLSFLGIGVKPPLPSWGNLAADGLDQLNPYKSYWWLLLFPCLLLGATLLALNFVGEGLREALDPKRAKR